MRTAMKDNKSMDFALEEAMKERGIVSEVVGAPVVYYNGHHYTLDHDTKTGLFSVLHTTGRDRGYRVLGEAGKTRDPKSALDMAEAHSKTMKEAENNPLIAALTERMKSDKEKESQRKEMSSKKKEVINVKPKLEEKKEVVAEASKGDYFISGSSYNGLPADEYDALIKQANDAAEKHSKHAAELKAAAAKANKGGKHATVVGGGYLKSVNASQHYRILADHLAKAKDFYHGGKVQKKSPDDKSKPKLKESLVESPTNYTRRMLLDRRWSEGRVKSNDIRSEITKHGLGFSPYGELTDKHGKGTGLHYAADSVAGTAGLIDKRKRNADGSGAGYIPLRSREHTATTLKSLGLAEETDNIGTSRAKQQREVKAESAPIEEAAGTSEKHYVAVAKILNDMYKQDHGGKDSPHHRAVNMVRSHMHDVFAADNKNFDHERFNKAVYDGIDESEIFEAATLRGKRLQVKGPDGKWKWVFAHGQPHNTVVTTMSKRKALHHPSDEDFFRTHFSSKEFRSAHDLDESKIFEASVGDRVGWNSEAGHDTGTIIKIHTKPFAVNGYTHHASEDDPQYAIKSKSGHVAYHKRGAIHSEEILDKLNEISTNTLASYIPKAAENSAYMRAASAVILNRNDKYKGDPARRLRAASAAYDKSDKRQEGIQRATDRLEKRATRVGEEILAEKTSRDGSNPVKFNIGMQKGRDGEAVPEDDIRKAVEAHGFKINRMHVKHPKDGSEAKAIVSTHTHHDKKAVAHHLMGLSKDLGQEAIAARQGQAGHLVGPKAAEWGGRFIKKFFNENEELITEALSSKTYISVAKRLYDAMNGDDGNSMSDEDRKAYHNAIRSTAHALSDYFAKDNPRFDSARFHKAAGTELNEDELNELSAYTLGQYLQHAINSKTRAAYDAGKIDGKGIETEYDDNRRNDLGAKYLRRSLGVTVARKKLVKKAEGYERVKDAIKEDELNELSPELLTRYIRKSIVDKGDRDRRGSSESGMSRLVTNKEMAADMKQKAAEHDKKSAKRFAGLLTATNKMKMKAIGEESLNELSPELLAKYIERASDDRVHHARRWGIDTAIKTTTADKEEKESRNKSAKEHAAKEDKRLFGVSTALRSLRKKSVKEEYEHPVQRGDHVSVRHDGEEWTGKVLKPKYSSTFGSTSSGASGHQIIPDPHHQSRYGHKPVNVNPQHVSRID